jgi:hypothetical protein
LSCVFEISSFFIDVLLVVDFSGLDFFASSGQTDERGGVSGDLPLSQGFDIGSNTSISKDNKISQGNGSENEIPNVHVKTI